MACDVKHLYGVNIAPVFDLLSDETSELLCEEHREHVHSIYERQDDYWIVGTEVAVTARGVVVTPDVEETAEAALRALPPHVLEEIRDAMRLKVDWLAVRLCGTVSEDEERAWRDGTIPAPRFHVCPYWG